MSITLLVENTWTFVFFWIGNKGLFMNPYDQIRDDQRMMHLLITRHQVPRLESPVIFMEDI